ncbi:MAG: DUF3142 domain-containing protein [Alsobacter sp.]
MRVLGMEVGADGRLVLVEPDFGALLETRLPVTAVIRVDGRAERLDRTRIVRSVRDLVARWAGNGLSISVEIDFDCATSRLDAYAGLLADVRTAIPQGARLSITALPTWMNSASLPGLLGRVDEVVLQVHAVRDPRLGLFDPVSAAAWVSAFAALSPRPLRVALPTYGARVTMRGDDVAAVEGERDDLSGGGDAFEVVADPRAIARFALALRERAADGLAGVVWFRLPVAGDRRAWSVATWRSVMAGAPEPYRGRVEVETRASGMRVLVVINDRPVDALAPRRIAFHGECPADGANGFELEEAPDGPVLVRSQASLLRAFERRIVGWTRCAVNGDDLNVEE